VSKPFSSENYPPVVRASSFTNVTIFIVDNPTLFMILGVYSDPHTDVEVLSGDDDDPQIDALTANLQAPDGDDAEGEGVSLVEPITPGLIGPNAPVQTDPFTADRAALGAPSAGGHKRKRPPTIPKHKQIKTLTV
jgi:hypothetical protein